MQVRLKKNKNLCCSYLTAFAYVGLYFRRR